MKENELASVREALRSEFAEELKGKLEEAERRVESYVEYEKRLAEMESRFYHRLGIGVGLTALATLVGAAAAFVGLFFSLTSKVESLVMAQFTSQAVKQTVQDTLSSLVTQEASEERISQILTEQTSNHLHRQVAEIVDARAAELGLKVAIHGLAVAAQNGSYSAYNELKALSEKQQAEEEARTAFAAATQHVLQQSEVLPYGSVSDSVLARIPRDTMKWAAEADVAGLVVRMTNPMLGTGARLGLATILSDRAHDKRVNDAEFCRAMLIGLHSQHLPTMAICCEVMRRRYPGLKPYERIDFFHFEAAIADKVKEGR